MAVVVHQFTETLAICTRPAQYQGSQNLNANEKGAAETSLLLEELLTVGNYCGESDCPLGL